MDVTEERLADLLAMAHYDLVAPILSESEYRAMAKFILARLPVEECPPYCPSRAGGDHDHSPVVFVGGYPACP